MLLLSLYSMPDLSLSSSTKFGSYTAKKLELEVNFQGRRPKRVTDPLNEMVRARLCGNHQEPHNPKDYSLSSGSEHEGESVISLTDMLCGFMEDEQGVCLDADDDSVSQIDSEDPNSALLLESLVSCKNAIELCLLRYVTHTVEMAKENLRFGYGNENENKSHLVRSLLSQLKMMGYNAGICKSRPKHIKQFPSGYYEYIDVIVERRKVKREERVFVDIDFRAQFELARPTMEYSNLLQLLPEIFVGKAERLHQIISIMCRAAKRSLKNKTMHIPPWRKYPYMRSKWLGSYRRITTPTTTTISTTPVSSITTTISSIPVSSITTTITISTTLVSSITTTTISTTPVSSITTTTTTTTLSSPPVSSSTTTIEMTNEWQLPTDNSSPKPAKNGKVSGLARAFPQPALVQ